jgi:hypothetical protein
MPERVVQPTVVLLRCTSARVKHFRLLAALPSAVLLALFREVFRSCPLFAVAA